VAEILIIEDDELLLAAMYEQVTHVGYRAHGVRELSAAERYLADKHVHAVLLDLALPDGFGLDFYEKHRDALKHTMVIVMTAVGEVEDAVRAMKLGAFDFLTKPVPHDELIATLARSLESRGEHLEAQALRISREQQARHTLVGRSKVFESLMKVVEDVARSDVNTILFHGETGTGKNALARQIHALSPRRGRPLLEVSCPAISPHLMESELFGHEKGAFTDAQSARQGVFEVADGGSVVLDEISEFDVGLQAKLLDVLEERRIRRVGGTRQIGIDVRVIALTNRDLVAMEREGQFRKDLRYRLGVFPIRVPPLRDRPEDILPLATHFLASLEPKLGRRFDGLSRGAENRLLSYGWPGNVRELRNVIGRAMLYGRQAFLEAGALMLDEFDDAPLDDDRGAQDSAEHIVPLREMERALVSRALAATGHNQSRAAELLHITRDQLRYRLKKCVLDRVAVAG
jgi:DNA-binding NtrC family response regulator